MLQGSCTPLGNLYGFWIILLKASMEEGGFADFMFMEDTDDMCFTYKGSPGNVNGLRKMIKYHLDEAEKVLFGEILFGLEFPALSEAKRHIYDNTSNIDVGYSFLKDGRNGYRDGFKCFMEGIYKSDDTSLHTFFGRSIPEEGGGRRWVWSRPNCLRWLQNCQRFLEHLLVSSHMTHGQPTRGTEMLSTTFANMENYPRSIFFIANEAVNGLAPNKGESMTQQRKISPHWFCPQNSSQLFVYLLLVRPVEIAIAKALVPKAADNYEYYLYTGPQGRWTYKKFSRLLEEGTEEFLGVDSSFGLADMRQILITLYYKHCNSLYWESESKTVSEGFAEEIGDIQANHSSHTRRAHYGVQKSEMGAGVSSDKVRAVRVVSVLYILM